jgi:hypothetical protein
MPFDTAVGDTPIAKAYVGTTPVKRIYAGSTHVWPPISTPIVWAGSTVASGTTNSFPAHLAGDLLVATAISTTSTARTPPSGYTTAYTSTTGFAALTVAYKWATATNTQFGSWPSGTAWTCSYVFRGVNKDTPFGSINSVAVESVKEGTAPAVSLNTDSGDSLVGHLFFNNGTSGVWGTLPAGVLSKNANARMSNVQKIDTRTATADPVTMTHTTGPVTFRTASFELLVPAPATYNGLYGVKVEYGDNYDVTFTALTSYAADPNEAFFFRSTPMTNDGYTARTFTKTYRSSAVPMDCTLEEYWATPSGVRNTINFQVMPKAVGGGVVEEIIP